MRRWLVAMVAWLALAGAASARGAGLGFEMYVGGLHAITAEVTVAVDGADYRVRSDVSTAGVLDFLARWRSRQHSEGVLRDGRARPRLHTRDGEWRFSQRASRLVYDGDGGVTVTVEPPPEADDRPPVPPALRRDTMDLLSLLVQAGARADPAATCQGTAAVYDGRRRYDVAFAAVGEELLTAQEYGPFSGRALHCHVALTPVAGFREDAAEESGLGLPKGVSIWLAPDAATGMVLPVRFQAEFPIGTVVGHLARVAAQP